MTGETRGKRWLLWVCPSCGRYTTDSDQIECGCDVAEWQALWVRPASDDTASEVGAEARVRVEIRKVAACSRCGGFIEPFHGMPTDLPLCECDIGLEDADQEVQPATIYAELNPASDPVPDGDAGLTWTIARDPLAISQEWQVVGDAYAPSEDEPEVEVIKVCPASDRDQALRERDEARGEVRDLLIMRTDVERTLDQARADLTRITQEHDASERLRLEQERSLNHKRDQALARAEELERYHHDAMTDLRRAEARLAEVERFRNELMEVGRIPRDIVPVKSRTYLADALDRALNETTSQEEGS